MKTTFEDRPIEIEEMECSYDYDYWCDAFIQKAYWLDTDKELTDEEYDRINESLDKDSWIMEWLY